MKEDSNSSAFKRRLNVVSDLTARSEDGREFQARAAATGNAWSPSVERRVDGRPESALRQTEDDDTTSEVRCSVSARYGGAVPCRHRCVMTQRRNLK